MITGQPSGRPAPRWLAAATLALTVVLTVAVRPASAAVAHWKLSARTAPTVLPLQGEQLTGENDQGIKGEGMLVLTASNLGDADIAGEASPVTITDRLPAGLEATEVLGESGDGVPGQQDLPYVLECTSALPATEISCSFPKQLPPYEQLTIQITVRSLATTPTRTAGQVSISGGGAAAAAMEQPVDIAGGPTSFGAESYELTPEAEDGSPELLAGSHPFQLTTTFDLNQDYGFNAETGKYVPEAPALEKELQFKLPPGLVGDPAAAPQCSEAAFGTFDEKDINSCPDDTAVGVAQVTFNDPVLEGLKTYTVPVFNLPPAPGEPARFGISVIHVPVLLDTSVRTGEDYGVSVTVHDTSQAVQILGAQVTLWGAPENPVHNDARGWGCLGSAHWVENFNPPRPCQGPYTASPEAAFLTLPTSCSALQSSVTGSSWSGQTLQAQQDSGTLTGCEQLAFQPALGLSPDEHTTSTPTGITLELAMPQQGTLSPLARGEADIRETTLTLPEGLDASPAAANGLQACPAAALGFNLPANGGYQPGLPETEQTDNNDFSPGLPAVSEAFPEPPCPQPSKLGTIEVQTPLLPRPLTGAVYLATQDTDPFSSPLVLYLIAEEPVSKVLVKLAGSLQIAENGQLTSTFKNTPPLPFEKLTIHLFNEHPAQTTPAFCGAYHATAQLAPWNSNPPQQTTSDPEEFQLTAGPNGGPCPPSPLPFAPTFHAGSSSSQAGAFTQFSLTLQNPNGDQALSGLTMHLPAGVAALLARVTPCAEPRAARDECGPESLLGESIASSGLGSDPVQLPGQVYLTGPYEGAPFGLAVVTPAVAGPFNLGDITVRSRINVDPHTAQVTITSDPFPTFVKGVPVQLKQIQVHIDRPNFEYNPTNCNPMSIDGTLTGSEGANTNVSSPFQVSGCQALPFKPGLTANTQGKTSKANGASLGLTFKSKTGEAHVAKTILTIPATLPARLTTIQKACLASVFEANPAGCPEGSDIGTAAVHTPVLKNPLTGPIYLVSHGNAAWPDAELVLQGEGVTVILDGQTAIKKGVTTSSFLSVPDAPFESVEATLPEGPHSALTTNLPFKDHYSLCGQSLTIPTALTGQNGTAVNENAKVTVQGCSAVKASKTKKLTRAQKLALALKTCRKHDKQSRAKRGTCERNARKRYSAKPAAHRGSSGPSRGRRS